MKPDQPENNLTKVADQTALEIPNGAAAAAILSAGIGCFLISLFGLMGDAFPALAHFFTFYTPTGPLSGVSTVAITVWLILWWILCLSWSGKALPMGKINIIAFLFLGVGFLVSFPPFGDFLQGK
jgi:hypothetical protein